MEKAKKYAVIAVFVLTIAVLSLLQLLPDQKISAAERRALAERPELRTETVLDGTYFSDLEEYLLDQFPFRDRFRGTKSRVVFDVFRMKDSNGLYRAEGHWVALQETLKSNQVDVAIQRIQAILRTHPEIETAYYSIIPDKNYFLAESSGHKSMDYPALLQQMHEGLPNLEYINIMDLLTIEDYYKSDSHWRQEKLFPVAQRLCEALDAGYPTPIHYTKQTLKPFYGVYAGQSGVITVSDDLSYMVGEGTEAAHVQSIEHGKPMTTYTTEDFDGIDPYDVFLSGAEALITIKNPLARSHRKLILFRDSFGSSLAPLLIDSYEEIVLVDLRYISYSLLDDLISFEDADVLFLYSTILLNSAGSMKPAHSIPPDNHNTQIN